MGISSKDSPSESLTKRCVSAFVFTLALFARQLLPEFVKAPSNHGESASEGMPLVTSAQVPNGVHGHVFARLDPAYVEKDHVPRMASSANATSSELALFTIACIGEPWNLPDSAMIVIVIMFVIFGFAASRIDVREMFEQHAYAATNDILFPTRSLIFAIVMLFIVVGSSIFFALFDSVFDQFTDSAPCVDAWFACIAQHASSDLLQFPWSLTDGMRRLLDSAMIALFIVVAFFGFMASRTDVQEMPEECIEPAENGFSYPMCSLNFVAAMLSAAVAMFAFLTVLKDVCGQILAQPLHIVARVASLAQQVSALPDSVMICLIIVFVVFGFVVSLIDVCEMSEETTGVAHGFPFPMCMPTFVALVLLAA